MEDARLRRVTHRPALQPFRDRPEGRKTVSQPWRPESLTEGFGRETNQVPGREAAPVLKRAPFCERRPLADDEHPEAPRCRFSCSPDRPHERLPCNAVETVPPYPVVIVPAHLP
ncbi:hypothetical protein DAETH_39520 (plasmid) [Deinococcus aetherius]|uniref:Uncharacterized protein n=1 Tax=Deinococcus aetherius TaxID=200252 RepID=A0ABM8AJW3_9DEIO|nr:hypothetical protein DAETH_39520 [Deinococcus aetherius]